MIQLDFRSRIKTSTPTPTPSVLRDLTPPKNLRLLATPTPQPWFKQRSMKPIGDSNIWAWLPMAIIEQFCYGENAENLWEEHFFRAKLLPKDGSCAHLPDLNLQRALNCLTFIRMWYTQVAILLKRGVILLSRRVNWRGVLVVWREKLPLPSLTASWTARLR